MRTQTLVALLCGLAGATSAMAETIALPDGQVQLRESPVERPKRGLTMSEVETKFGAPAERHATVGQPPITRWDYPSFSVFFEHDRVIHSVALGGASLPPPPGSQPAVAARPAQPSQARQAAAPSVPEATLRPGMYKSPPEPAPAASEATPPAPAETARPADAPQQPAPAESQAAAQPAPAQQPPAQNTSAAAAGSTGTQPLQADYPLQSDQSLQSDSSHQ